MTGRTALDEIEDYLDALEAGLGLGDPADLEIPEPALDGASIEATEAERARTVLERLQQLQARADGQRMRIAGEIAGLRKRSVNDGHRRSPSRFDTAF
ncbi:MAG: hypothetical protein AAGA90_14945 [Actinomycetota bacterium]